MSEPRVEYLPTKDGKQAPQEFAVASHLAKTCMKCNKRKAMFLKAAFCDVCKLLWFYNEIERIGPAKEMWSRPELSSFSKLELERLTWITECIDKPYEIRYWNKWIKEKSEELYEEWKELTSWTPNATYSKVGRMSTS